MTNRNSQTTIGHPLIQGAVLYGYSIMSETGTLILTNSSTDRYKLTDSIFNINTIIPNDTTFIVYPFVGAHILHTQNMSPSGLTKDTLIQVQCGDTSSLIIPF